MRLTISSDPRLLQVVRSAVRHYARLAGFPESDVECLAMAVDEAGSNVIRHAYGNERNGRIVLEIVNHPDRIEFVLEDRGAKARAESITHRPLDQIRPGGLGTFFIKCFTDSFTYDTSFSEGNRWRLVKYRPKKGGAKP